MIMWKENNVDMEALASFEEELLPNALMYERNIKKSNLHDLGTQARSESMP